MQKLRLKKRIMGKVKGIGKFGLQLALKQKNITDFHEHFGDWQDRLPIPT